MLAMLFGALLASQGAVAQITDSFSRANSPDLGNGWIEKNPAAFSIGGQTAVKGPGVGYLDNLAYRPASEDLLDVEASVEFELSSASPGYPQILVRVQSNTVAVPGVLDGYIIYVNGGTNEAILGRQVGGDFVTTLASLNLNPLLNTTDNFRMRLRATGTNPVQLNAWIEREDGANWQIIGQASASDAAAARIATPGTVGFGGYIESSYSYDNFVATDLGSGSNPSPTLTSLNPNSAAEGGSAFLLTINGTDFVPASVVRWDGADRATTYVSPTELQATITAADIAAAGTAAVTVFTPAPGGGISGALTFTVDPGVSNNPAPVLNAIAPDNADEGGPAFTLTATGADFVPGSVIRWNGADRATTFVSATEIEATITAADIAADGTANATVFTPGPGGGTSAPLVFTINQVVVNNPTPVLNTINPTTATEGDPGFTLTANGADFVPGSVVRWDGANRATTYVSPTELTAAIPASDVAAPGNANVTVFSPGPGGGTSAGLTFAIDPLVVGNPVPAISGLNPGSTDEGGPGFSLTVNGSGFVAASVVRWDGADRATTFVSATELTAQISSADIANDGSASVTVVSPAPGGGTSNAATFTIDAVFTGTPDPAISSLSPDNTTAGTNNLTVTIIGSGFTNQSVARWNNQDRPTTFINNQVIEMALSTGDLSASTVGTVTVFANGALNEYSAPQPFFVLDPTSAFFFDNFNTTDGPNIGNGWTEKDPNAFSIQDGEIVSQGTANQYRENIAFRPIAEDRQDLEVSAEFVRQPNGAFTQLHARAQRSTVALEGFLESYIFYIEEGATPISMAFAISPATQNLGECLIDQIPLPAPFQVGERYRMTFRVTGQDPVQMDGRVEQFTAGEWQTIFDEQVLHDENTPVGPFYCAPGFMPPPITNGGTMGFSKWVNQADNYDNYYWIDLSGVSAAPGLTSASPSLIEQNGPAFSLTLDGSNFSNNSVVNWNGNPRPTTFIDSTTLVADIPASDIAVVGPASITVSTPPPGGGLSNAITIDVFPQGQQPNPVPTIASINPSSLSAGGGTTQVDVTGTGFVPTSVVRWNGSDRTTGYVSDTLLTVTIPAADVSSPGIATMTVFNPTPAGGLSDGLSVSVVASGDFVDDFNRANSTDPGNGWLEKNPAAFSIVGNRLQKNGVTTNYIDNVMYRPIAEVRGNVETSIEMNVTAAFPGYPQLFARLQPSTVGLPGFLDGYILYVNGANEAVVGRQRDQNFVTTLATINFSEALNQASTYRMRLSVTGTSPVVVTGYVERQTGTGFVVIGQATANDSTPLRLTVPGVSGIGGYVEGTYIYDNFRDTNL